MVIRIFQYLVYIPNKDDKCNGIDNSERTQIYKTTKKCCQAMHYESSIDMGVVIYL